MIPGNRPKTSSQDMVHGKFITVVLPIISLLSFVENCRALSTFNLNANKSIDFYVNFPSRVTDLILGNNTQGWANTTVSISHRTRTIYQCCNGFLLGSDGRQEYTVSRNGTYGKNTWGQDDYVNAGKRVIINIDPATNSTVTAAAICKAALARKEAYAAELLEIARHEKIQGYTLDWEDATGNDISCFNDLWQFVSTTLKPHGLHMDVSMDASNHQGPMDDNSTEPWSTEWDYAGFVSWASTLVNMGTYPGSWSNGLSFPAAQYIEAKPCPKYPQKWCGLEGQILDMLEHNVDPNMQLSPGLWPTKCSANGTATDNGWTEAALKHFLAFLDDKNVTSVTIWFNDALQVYSDSFTCPWFLPTILNWADSTAFNS